MSLDLLIALSWKSALCAGATLALLSLTKRRSAAQRSRIAHVGLAVVLLLPAVAVLMPAVAIRPPEPIVRLIQPLDNHAIAGVATLSDLRHAVPHAFTPLLPLNLFVPILIGVPALLLLLCTVIAVPRLGRLRTRSKVVVDVRWLSALAQTQDSFGFKHGAALLVSSELTSPISWGLARPVILLGSGPIDMSAAI